MKILYVDNFRGFTDTYIPIEDVNFFVGENSTGKTSILSLIKILSEPQFLLSLNFESEEIDLGNFEDIVSYLSENKKSFTVGPFEEHEGKEKKQIQMSLISFKNQQNIPVVETYTFKTPNGLVHIKNSPKSIKFKIDDRFAYNNKESFSFKMFLGESIKEHKKNSLGYKSIPQKLNVNFRGSPFGIITNMIESYVSRKDLPKEGIFPSFRKSFNDVTWVAPIREKPKRTYDQYKLGYSPEGTHTPYLLNDFLGDRGRKESPRSLLKALEKFGVDSELFKTIKVKRYGRHKTAPFEVDVVLNEEPLKISNVGYGVAQVLPILVECFLRRKGSAFAIQQPEVHLHPKAQASLGDYFHSMASLENKKFFIETHSDFLIDRFRRMQNKGNPVKAQVLFFERTKNGNTVHLIRIDKNGKYGEDQPESFRKFFINEELEMLSL